MLGFTPSERWWARQGLNLRPHPCEGLFNVLNDGIPSTRSGTERDSFANEAQFSDQKLTTRPWTDDDYRAAGYVVKREGKMVSDGQGGVTEQVVIIPPGLPAKYTPRPLPKVGTIYFVGPEGGPVKIGFASRLEFRLKDLRTANAYPLQVHATIEGPPCLERDYHKRFAAHRLHGEWFAPHPDILAEIDRLEKTK